MSGEPRYWGSWKGRVVRAIAVDRAQTWNEIRDQTGLSPLTLNKVLSELFDAKAIEKDTDSRYWVSKELYKAYKDYVDKHEPPAESVRVKITEAEQKDLVTWIDSWREVKELDFSLKSGHFFLEGRHLDELSKELMSKAKQEVLVVNPYVNKCDLSDMMRDTAKAGRRVRLVTRRPDADKEGYHKTLKASGVQVFYNDVAHAKLIVVDRKIAIASSMNFYAASSGGKTWEAGLVTIEDVVVESVMNSILRPIEKPESIEA